MPLLFIQGGQSDLYRRKSSSVTLSDALYLAKLNHEYKRASTPEEKRVIADKAIKIAREKYGDDLEVVEGKMNRAKELVKFVEQEPAPQPPQPAAQNSPAPQAYVPKQGDKVKYNGPEIPGWKPGYTGKVKQVYNARTGGTHGGKQAGGGGTKVSQAAVIIIDQTKQELTAWAKDLQKA
jgi:hypothetical protein